MATDGSEQSETVAESTADSSLMGNNAPSPDEIARLDQDLMDELAGLNRHLGQYVLKYYETKVGRTAPLSVVDERALGDSLAAAAEAIRARAARRDLQDGGSR